jgi:hypothetical protein
MGAASLFCCDVLSCYETGAFTGAASWTSSLFCCDVLSCCFHGGGVVTPSLFCCDVLSCCGRRETSRVSCVLHSSVVLFASLDIASEVVSYRVVGALFSQPQLYRLFLTMLCILSCSCSSAYAYSLAVAAAGAL